MKNITQLKKIVFICIMLCFSFLGVASAQETVDKQYSLSEERLAEQGVLNALGILNVSEEQYVTRKEFSVAAASILNYDIISTTDVLPFTDVKVEDDFYSSLSTLYNLDIISASDKFRPNDNITENEALKIAVVTLGYEYDAQKYGGWPYGYGIAGTGIGISGFSNVNGILERDEFIRMFYKILDAKTRAIVLGSNKIEENGTVLESFLKVKAFEGTLEANSRSGLLNPNKATSDNRVIIGGEEFLIPEKGQAGVADIEEYLGCKVRIYVPSQGDTDNILAYELLSEKEELSADKVNAFNNFTIVTDKEKFTLDRNYNIIFNGVSASDCSESELLFKDGKYDLFDIDNNGKYDLVHVWKTDYVLVESFTINGRVVSDFNEHKYGKNNLSSICLNDEDVEYDFYKKSGATVEECSLEELMEFSTLAVNISRNEKYIKVVAFDNSLHGDIQGVGDDKIWVNGTEYILSGYSTYKTWRVGSNQLDVFLTEDNKFLSAISKADNMKYGYLMVMEKTNALGDYEAYILKSTGEKVILKFEDKVYIDNVKQDVEYVINNNILEEYQVIRYSEVSGIIKRIDLSQNDKLYEKNLSEYDNLRLYYQETMYWYPLNRMLAPYMQLSNPVIFNVPTKLKTNKAEYDFNVDDFFVGEFPLGNNEFPVDIYVYDADEYRDCGAILRFNDANPEIALPELTINSHLSVVDSCKMGINNDGNAVRKVVLIEADKFKTYYFSELLNKTFDNNSLEINPGDVVRFETTGDYITNLRVEFNYKEWEMDENLDSTIVEEYRNHPTGGRRTIVHYYIGNVYSYTGKMILIRDELDGEISPILYANSVMRYSKEKKSIVPISRDELLTECNSSKEISDKVVAVTRYFENTYLLIVYGE